MATTYSKSDVYELVTNRIIEQMEQGIIPWQKPWHGGMDGAISYTTGKPYSLINQFLLGRDGEFLTFKQVQDLGGKVKKGAKSQMVVFFKQYPIVETCTNEDGEEVQKVKNIPILRYYNVFHISDCEGIQSKIKEGEKPASTLKPNEFADKIATDYVERANILLMIKKSDKACYCPASDSVTCPLMEQFDEESEYYSTLFHELTHSTGAENRLKRNLNEGHFGNEPYAKEELVAEIGAAYLVQYVGYDCPKSQRNNVAYLLSWIKALKNDHKLIVSAASKAQKAVDFILGVKESAE